MPITAAYFEKCKKGRAIYAPAFLIVFCASDKRQSKIVAAPQTDSTFLLSQLRITAYSKFTKKKAGPFLILPF